MSQIVEYLDGPYSTRLLSLKIDVFKTVVDLTNKDPLTDADLQELGKVLWDLYAEFMNETRDQVMQFPRDAYDTEERHVNMMTSDYIITYVDHEVFTAVIIAYEAMSAERKGS